MNYIEMNLLKDEKIVYFTRPHWIIFSTPVIFLAALVILSIFSPILFPNYLPFTKIPLAMVIVLVCLGAVIVSGIGALISYATSEYAITNKRIMMKIGWISRDSLEIFIDKVEAIYVDQSILGRILDYGKLRIVGTGGTQDPFFYIPHPLVFRKIAQEQIDFGERNKKK